MNQRGFVIAAWMYLAGAVALIAAFAGLVMAWDSFTDGLIKEGYDAGVSETRATYTARDNAQLQAALAETRKAQELADKAESAAAAAQADASKLYAKGVLYGKADTDRLVAAARAGNGRLRDPGAKAASGPACNSQTGAGAVAAGPSRGNGGAPAELPATPSGLLSTEASEFLLVLTGEADDTARQLAAAQAVIVSDRVLCNGSP